LVGLCTPRHEGTNRYAVSAALQLSRLLDQVNGEFNLEPPLQQRGGITQGLIFSGEIGAVYRRESVIAGPAVNRAARLMSKAQTGQIILDSDIWNEARAAFVGDPLPPVTLKGIQGQVVIVNVRGMARYAPRRRNDLFWVGRLNRNAAKSDDSHQITRPAS
jgi:class 3 adenylate cyclase